MGVAYERLRDFEPGCSRTYKAFAVASRLAAHSYFTVDWRDRANVPETGPVVLASNHQMYVDPFLIACALRRRVDFLTLQSLQRRRTLGWILDGCHCIPIGGTASVEGFRCALHRLSAGNIVGVFPEGERTWTGAMGAFSDAPILLASRAQAVIVPVAISGGFEVFPRTRRIPRRGPISITFGQPWAIPELPRGRINRRSETESLSQEMRDKIGALLDMK